MKSSLAVGLGVVAVIVVGGVIYAGYHKSGTASPYGTTMSMPSGTMSPSSSNANTPAVAASSVSIANFAFSPANIAVKVGTKVTWTNTDGTSHTVTGDGLNSGTLGKGESYSFTFTKAGTYNYICSFHPYMKGSVTVTQ